MACSEGLTDWTPHKGTFIQWMSNWKTWFRKRWSNYKRKRQESDNNLQWSWVLKPGHYTSIQWQIRGRKSPCVCKERDANSAVTTLDKMTDSCIFCRAIEIHHLNNVMMTKGGAVETFHVLNFVGKLLVQTARDFQHQWSKGSLWQCLSLTPPLVQLFPQENHYITLCLHHNVRPQQWWLRMLLFQFLHLSKPQFQISWPLVTAFLHGFIISITWIWVFHELTCSAVNSRFRHTLHQSSKAAQLLPPLDALPALHNLLDQKPSQQITITCSMLYGCKSVSGDQA